MKEDPVPAWFRKGNTASQDTPHGQAENLMFQIDAARRSGDNGLAKELSLKAARLEEEVLQQTPLDLPRTRGIFGLSAVSLYFKAEDFDNVIRLGCVLIEEINPVSHAYYRNGILEMLEAVNKLKQPPSQ